MSHYRVMLFRNKVLKVHGKIAHLIFYQHGCQSELDYSKIMNINAIKEARYTFLCNLTSLTFELSLLNRLNILGRSSLRVLHHVDYVLQ